MFEQKVQEPWYSSLAVLVVICILLPPIGLIMPWLNRKPPIHTPIRKIIGTLALILVSIGYMFLYASWERSAENNSHYAVLEQHRQQQAAQPAPTTAPVAAVSPSPQASASASPAETTAQPAPARNY